MRFGAAKPDGHYRKDEARPPCLAVDEIAFILLTAGFYSVQVDELKRLNLEIGDKFNG